MTAIPAKSAFTGSSVTEGEFKTALETLHDYLTGILGSAGTQAAALSMLGSLGGSVQTRSTDYTVTASDRGRVINCTGSWTLTLTSAATLGSGFMLAVVNSGTGSITVDPAGSETIAGKLSLNFGVGSSAILVSDGIAWQVIGAATGAIKGYQLFTSSGTFTVPDGVSKVKATIIGGGGGGCGGGDSVNGQIPGGNGGNGGGWCGYISVNPGSQLSVIVGLGGSGSNNNSSSASGGGGSSSIFGGVECTGGYGGLSAWNNTGSDGANGSAISSAGFFGSSHSFDQNKRSRGLSSTNAVVYSESGPYYPGAGGSGESGYSANNASGGVGGLVLIEW